MAVNKMVFDVDEMLDSFTRDGMKKFVKRLLMASEDEEKAILARLGERASSPEKESEDLADLRAEKRGAPTPIDPDEEPTRRKKNG